MRSFAIMIFKAIVVTCAFFISSVLQQSLPSGSSMSGLEQYLNGVKKSRKALLHGLSLPTNISDVDISEGPVLDSLLAFNDAKPKNQKKLLKDASTLQMTLEAHFQPLLLEEDSVVAVKKKKSQNSRPFFRRTKKKKNSKRIFQPTEFCPEIAFVEFENKSATCLVEPLRAIRVSVSPAAFQGAFFINSERSISINCNPTPDCRDFLKNRYRRIDGLCNNIERDMTWGASGGPLVRIVPQKILRIKDYPPVFFTKSGEKLPNAQEVSVVIHDSQEKRPVNNSYPPSHIETPKVPSDDNRIIVDDTGKRDISLMLMQFGQFLDHDIGLTPELSELENESECGKAVDCCKYINERPSKIPESCMPIPAFKKTLCADFKVSMVTCQKSKDHQPLNSLTSYLDASHIYGSDDIYAKNLREFKGGRLKENSNYPGYMPFNNMSSCLRKTRQFLSGDTRSTEQVFLAPLHILMLKEHNRVAGLLEKRPFTSVSDEVLYQETRRLVYAELQNIIYREFLPIVLGPKIMQKMRLDISRTTKYDSRVNPGVINAFSTAAFRFGHSLIRSIIQLYRNERVVGVVRLQTLFFNTSLVFKEGADTLLEAIISQSGSKFDRSMTHDIQYSLLPSINSPSMMSLAARNIQRGRDHKIGFYDEYRQFCGLPGLPHSFKHPPPPEFSDENWKLLSSVYSVPSLIELFPGGMSETPFEGAMIGHTFSCIIGLQFHNLLYGDRYFFTHRNVPEGFSDVERKMVLKRTLRDILCDNTEIRKVQINVFKTPSKKNPRLHCFFRNRFRL